MRPASCIVTLAVLSLGTHAWGEESPEERARPHVEAGRAAFAGERYEEAIREFQAAHELIERPMLLYNIAVCHERLEHRREAVDVYFQYLSAAPEAENADEVRSRIDRLQHERVEERDREVEVETVDGEDTGAASRRQPLLEAHHEIGAVLGTNLSLYNVHAAIASFSLAGGYSYRFTPTWHAGTELLIDFYGKQVGDQLRQNHYGLTLFGRWALQLGRRFELQVPFGVGYQLIAQPHDSYCHWLFLRAGATVVWDVYRGFGFRISLNVRMGYISYIAEQFGAALDVYGGIFWAI
jgi:tetratricopeptide (TPR) repeat protein